MPTLEIFQPSNGTSVTRGQPVSVTGKATEPKGTEPVLIDSVTVQVDGEPAVDATLKLIKDPNNVVVTFTASVQVTGAEGTHTITVVATNDGGLSRSETVTVFLGPVFEIDAPAMVLEVNVPSAVDPGDSSFQRLLGRIQQGLVPISTSLAAAGKLIAGPNVALAQDTSGLPVLRIGLWIEDIGFPVQAPSPPEFPLPRLSDTAATAGFALAPLLPTPHRRGLTDLPFAISISAAALQQLADAALASSPDQDVDSISVTVSAPDSVTTSYNGRVADRIVPYTITVTETLGTAPILGVDPPQTGPTVSSSRSTSVGDVPDWLIGTFTKILDVGLLMVWQDVSRAADETGGVAAPLVADLPTRIPFHNTDFSLGAGFDFPVLVADWANLGISNTGTSGLLGSGDATIRPRDDSMVGMQIMGPDFIQVPAGEFVANQSYTILLPNFDPVPGALAWQLRSLRDNATDTGTVDVGSFTQAADLDIDFPLAPHLPPGDYHFVLSLSATETCGTDASKIFTRAASKEITVRKPKSRPQAERSRQSPVLVKESGRRESAAGADRLSAAVASVRRS
jgi:hypothetical protein